jgi:hypothetical protein
MRTLCSHVVVSSVQSSRRISAMKKPKIFPGKVRLDRTGRGKCHVGSGVRDATWLTRVVGP